MSNSSLIREFFSTPNKPVTYAELKDLTSGERAELAALITAEASVPDAA